MSRAQGASRQPARQLRMRDEAGYAAVVVALLASVVFMGCAALGVDTARWYVEAERLQKAADAAALSGVTYMPNELAKATTAAKASAKKNGFDAVANPANVKISVGIGSRASELKVTISSRVVNTFGSAIGVDAAWVTRSATADYTAPAPMGSPCNTFGNEPRGSSGASTVPPTGTALPTGSGATFPQCPRDATSLTSQPQFWGSIEGPETDKTQGDRYNTNNCTEVGNAGTVAYGCSGGKNTEYLASGTYFAVHVEPGMVGRPIELQVYDPTFVLNGTYCYNRPSKGSSSTAIPLASAFDDSMNPWTTDGKNRYGAWKNNSTDQTTINAANKEFCTGDSYPGTRSTNPVTTSFVLRGQTDTNNPKFASVINTTDCPITQFRGYGSYPTYNSLKSTASGYNSNLAQLWHQWYKLCTFTPSKAGDYYLQVRTNVSLAGTAVTNTGGNQPLIYKGNTLAGLDAGNTLTGAGSNSFAIRAIPNPATDANKKLVAVSGYERMPLLQNSPSSTATFNLVRALPNAKGQFLTFDFFDAADGSDGNVKVLPPTDATGSVKVATGIANCKTGMDGAAPTTFGNTKPDCSVDVRGTTTDGHLVHMVIPIPTDYSCDASTLGGCWFRVQMAYGGNVTDFTTWSANIGGDPVRLIK